VTDRRRVAVTGMGVKTPAGLDLDTFWKTLLAGKSAAKSIDGYDISEHPVTFACEIHDFDPVPYMGVKEARRADRVGQFGLTAAIDAVSASGVAEPGVVDPARVGVIVGSGVGGLRTHEEQERIYIEKDRKSVV